MKKLTLGMLIFFCIQFTSCQNPSQSTFPNAEQVLQETLEKDDVWVFILAGQSNMAGRAIVEPADTIPSGRIITINKKNELIYAKEPIHFYEPTNKGLDCGLTFGKALLNKIPDSISILLIPTAVGGSSITKWINDKNHRNVQLLSNLKEKVALARKHGEIKAVLWHQGESDADTKENKYYQKNLEKLFEKFREITEDSNLTILVGTLGEYSGNKNWTDINSQITAYTTTDKNAFLVETTGLKDRGDKIHFNSEAQRLLGKRYAYTFLKATNQTQ